MLFHLINASLILLSYDYVLIELALSVFMEQIQCLTDNKVSVKNVESKVLRKPSSAKKKPGKGETGKPTRKRRVNCGNSKRVKGGKVPKVPKVREVGRAVRPGKGMMIQLRSTDIYLRSNVHTHQYPVYSFVVHFYQDAGAVKDMITRVLASKEGIANAQNVQGVPIH